MKRIYLNIMLILFSIIIKAQIITPLPIVQDSIIVNERFNASIDSLNLVFYSVPTYQKIDSITVVNNQLGIKIAKPNFPAGNYTYKLFPKKNVVSVPVIGNLYPDGDAASTNNETASPVDWTAVGSSTYVVGAASTDTSGGNYVVKIGNTTSSWRYGKKTINGLNLVPHTATIRARRVSGDANVFIQWQNVANQTYAITDAINATSNGTWVQSTVKFTPTASNVEIRAYSCKAGGIATGEIEISSIYIQEDSNIPVLNPPLANFSFTPSVVNVGESVQFTDTSTNSPTSWLWNISGGSPYTSTGQNPVAVYNTAGTYSVYLKATNADGFDEEVKSAVITVNNVVSAPPVADFTMSTTNVTKGQTVNFMDISSNTPTSWSWLFSGGTPNSSTVQNPSVVYNTVGSFSVTLVATNADGSDTEVKSAVINVTDINTNIGLAGPVATAPIVNGTFTPTSASDMENSSNANKRAIITNSFSATNATFASNITIEPNGGSISGSNINLNDAYIEENGKQAFSSSVSFTNLYDKTRVSPELFGAISGDAIDDNSAINALINNSQFATCKLNGAYIKNNHTNYTRSGQFNWDMNGAKVSITNTSNFNMTKVSVDAVFDMTNISPVIYNGEFDGTDVYGRLFYLHGQPYFSFRNLRVHDLYSPNAIRCVAFRFTVSPNSSGFVYGEFKDNLIEDIVAQGDGNYNDTRGIAKAFWWTLQNMSGTSFNVVYQNNVVRNIIGDDAEGFYAIGGANATHTSSFLFDNEDYRYCTRRAIKANVSNVTVRNSYFEEIPESLFDKAQQMGSMIDFFSTSSGYNIKNIRVHDNVIRTVPGNNAHYYLLSLTEVDDVIIENNTFTMQNLHTYGGIRLGSNTSTYNGDLKDVVIRNNTFNNTYIQAMQNYNPNNTLDINTNTFNWSSTLGYQIGAFRFYGSGTKGDVDFVNNTLNVNMSSTNGVNGVISSDPAVTGVVNFNIDNATVTYSNSKPARPFGYLQSNFNNTNTIQNSTINGDVGTQAVEVTGVQTVNIVNSKGDNNTPITVK